MFGTSIHWTTFFYLLIDVFIVIVASIQALNNKRSTLRRFIVLGILFVLYNLTGGFLPTPVFPGPLIIQYIITYGVAIALCVYLAYYFYKEYDITILRLHFSIKNIVILMLMSFICLYLVPFFILDSIDVARSFFGLPTAIVAFYFLWAFKERIENFPKTNVFTARRNKLALLCVSCIALLPVLTVVGDYQWLTFTVMNVAFFAVTVIEIDRYLYFLENKGKMLEVFAFYKTNKEKLEDSKLIYQSLTRREVEIALSILSKKSYKSIGKEFFIAQRTVSKHASNIFKKTGVKNRSEFLKRFGRKNK